MLLMSDRPSSLNCDQHFDVSGTHVLHSARRARLANSTVDMGRETRQQIRATSSDRLASETLEEREARLMSHTARV